MTARRLPPTQGMSCVLAGRDRSQTLKGGGKPQRSRWLTPSGFVRTERIP